MHAGQKYCTMLQREHSAILSTFIKLPVVIKTFVLSIFERRFYTGFTVLQMYMECFKLKYIQELSKDSVVSEFYTLPIQKKFVLQ